MPTEDLAGNLTAAIARYAPDLHVPEGINAIALLRALASQETSDPSRTRSSKHENSYCYGGRYHTSALRQVEWKYGCAVHSSWSPWQIMYATAALRGFEGDPVELRDPMVAGQYVVAELNERVFDLLQDVKLQDIFDEWNSGTARDNLMPAKYISEATDLYNHFAGLTT